MKLIVCITLDKPQGFAAVVKACEVYLPHQYGQVDDAPVPRSVFYIEIPDEEVLPYALSIVGSRGGEIVERAGP